MNMRTETHTPFKPPVNAAAWFEIPVRDMVRAKRFYERILLIELTEQNDGTNPMAVFAYGSDGNNVSGHLYPGRPASDGAGPTVHLNVPDDLEAAMERVGEAGGKIVSPIIEIPSGRFAYCIDPDGNSIGLFSR
jgi:uncharacterized protein